MIMTVDEDEDSDVGAAEVLHRGLTASPELKTGFLITVAMAMLSAAGKLMIPIRIQLILDEGYLPDSNRKRGNSLSAPHVAGAIALMLSANKELTPWRVKQILEETATDVRPRGKDNQTGAGILHAFRAVKAAQAERK